MSDPTPAAVSLPSVRELVTRLVEPRAAALDASASMMREIMPDIAAPGLIGIEVPAALGGLGASYGEKVEIAQIISAVSMGAAFSLINTQNVASRIAAAPPEVRDRFLPSLLAGERFGSTALTEPSAGSDFAAIRTLAKPVDGGWRLTGAKAWITNMAFPGVIICYAQTDPALGGGGIGGFIVDAGRDGFVREKPYEMAGAAAIGAGGFSLDDYFVPDDEVLVVPGEGFKSALGGVNGARTYVAAMVTAMVRESLSVAVAYGAERQAFGQPVIQHQGLAWSLATVANKLRAAELLTADAVTAVESDDPKAAILPAAHAKKFACEIGEPAIAACMQAMGAEGLLTNYPFGRHLDAARVANYVDGTTEMQTDRIASLLVKEFGR